MAARALQKFGPAIVAAALSVAGYWAHSIHMSLRSIDSHLGEFAVHVGQVTEFMKQTEYRLQRLESEKTR